MSFWTADEKIPVQQTKVSIPAEHGLDYSAGQKINIIIPPTIKYFQPKESYLHFDVELSNTFEHPVKMSLDGETGGQCLIKDIRIHSGGAGAVLLEEIQNYNTLTSLKYDYESNDAIRDKRAMTEGALSYTPTQRGTMGQPKTVYNNTRINPYSTPYKNNANMALPILRSQAGAPPTGCDGKIWGEDGNVTQGSQYNKVKCLLPLHTGIFQSPKVFPALLTEGLRIEIILEDANKVYRLPDQLAPNRKCTMGLQFHSWSGIDNDVDDADNGVLKKDGAATYTEFFVQRTNNMIDFENCPFVIGQKIAFYQDVLWADKFKVGDIKKRAKTDVDLVINSLRFILGGDAATQGGTYGLLGITCATFKNMSDADINSSWFVKDDSVLNCICTSGKPSSTVANVNYKVKNTELILQTLTMPQGYTQKLMNMMATGGAMNYDFLSFTNYKYSQLTGDRVMNMRLPLNQTKAKAVLCIPTDSSVYSTRQLIAGEDTTILATYPDLGGAYPAADMPAAYTYVDSIDYWDRGNASHRTGLTGIADEVTDYQFFYNGQLNPSRKVDCDRISRRQGVQQQPLIELEKALAMAGIQPLSFMKFRENFCIGRALALQQGVYNTAGRDFNLQVNYQGVRKPVKPKLWNNYVAHIRRLMVQGDSVVVQI